MLPPNPVTHKVSRDIFSFFWDGSTERLARDALRLPRRSGGYGLPCIDLMSQLLALRVVSSLLSDVEAPGRPLILYFLGPSRRVLCPTMARNLHPSAAFPPRLFKAVITLAKEIRALDADLDFVNEQPARLCEKIVTARSGRRVDPPDFPWLRLTSGRLPEDAKNIQWQKAWRILPTKDRLFRWGVTQNSSCPNCGQPESTAHTFSSCTVARCFWRIIHRAAPSLGLARYQLREQCPGTPLGKLFVVIGDYILWRNRCRAVAQNRRLRMQWPLLSFFRQHLVTFLEGELALLGEEEFLRHWSTRFIEVSNKRVIIHASFPDLCP